MDDHIHADDIKNYQDQRDNISIVQSCDYICDERIRIHITKMLSPFDLHVGCHSMKNMKSMNNMLQDRENMNNKKNMNIIMRKMTLKANMRATRHNINLE